MRSDRLRLYVLGGAGFMRYKRNPDAAGPEDTPDLTTRNRLMLSGGAGIDWRIGGTSIFLEGRYDVGLKADGETGSARAFIPLVVGARWGAR
jgi:hypothetical protein